MPPPVAAEDVQRLVPLILGNRLVLKLITLGDAAVETATARIDGTTPNLLWAALFLARAAGRRVSRVELCDLLWPGASPDAQRHRLRSLLHRLRRLGVPILATPHDVMLEPPAPTADFEQFQDSRWVLDHEEMLGRAGVVLPASFDDDTAPELTRWVEELREEVARQITRGLLGALQLARADRDWQRVERVAEACRRVDPLNEEAHLALAEALCSTASKERALAVLAEYEREMGTEGKIAARLPVRLLRERILAAGEARDEGAATAAFGDAPFVGRANIRLLLGEAFDQTVQRHGGARVLWGPSGIGKSRLIAEFVHDATLRGATSVTISCQPGDSLRPLSVLFDLLPILLELPGALACDSGSYSELQALIATLNESRRVTLSSDEANVRRTRIEGAMLNLLDAIADERPLVVAIDDAQWMDPGLAPFWDAVLPWSRTRAVLWVFACRAESADEMRRVFGIREASAIDVPPLEDAAAAELVDRLLSALLPSAAPTEAARARIAERGGGSPLVLRELVRHYLETRSTNDLPASIATLIRERLDRQSRTALRVLQGAALLGSYATTERVEAILALPRAEFVDALAELADAGIVAPQAEGLIRGHALWGDAALGRMGPLVGSVLHRHAAERLESELAATPSVPLVWECARHWRAAGDHPRALTSVVRGAEHLAANGFVSDAATAYGRAVEECQDAARRLELLRRQIDLLQTAGRWGDFADAVAAHETLAADLDPTYDTHNDFELARRYAIANHGGDVLAVPEEALACARNERCSTTHRLGATKLCLQFAERLGAREQIAEAFRIATTLPLTSDRDRRLRSHVEVLYYLATGDPEAAVTSGERWTEVERAQSGTHSLEFRNAVTQTIDALIIAGHIEKAWSLSHELLASARRNSAEHQKLAHDNLIVLSLEFESPDTSALWIRRFRELLDDLHDNSVVRRVYLPMYEAQLAAIQGDGARALQLARPLDECLGFVASRFRTRFLAVHLAAHLLLGDSTEVHWLADLMEPGFAQPDRWLDWPATVYARYLSRFRGAATARAFVTRFVAEIRHERYAPHADLRAFLTPEMALSDVEVIGSASTEAASLA